MIKIITFLLCMFSLLVGSSLTVVLMAILAASGLAEREAEIEKYYRELYEKKEK